MGPFLLVQTLWLFLPAYVANMAPVLAMKLAPGWSAPIDGGRLWRDGRRVLGAGKTWRGLGAACVAGALAAMSQSLVRTTAWDLSDFAYTASGGMGGPLLLGLALGLGTAVGDAVKSFFKRRTGRVGGAPWVPFDQLDFVVGGLAFGAAASWLLAATGATRDDWFSSEFLGGRWPVLVVLFVATPLLHFVVNVIGFKLRLKKVPW